MPTNIGQAVIYGIILIAILAIGYFFLTASGLPIPSWVLTIFWIVLVAIVCIYAIKFLMANAP